MQLFKTCIKKFCTFLGKLFLFNFSFFPCLGIQAFTSEDANLYMDRVLNGRFVEEAGYSRLDPYKIDDFQLQLNSSYGVKAGNAVLDQGKLIHLSKVRRSADCTVPVYQSANVTFTCFLRFDKLQVNYTANVSYENVGIKFFPKVHIEGTNITVQATSNREDDVPNLKLLFINRIGNMTVTAKMISIGNLDIRILPPIREALERKTMMTLHQAIGGRFKDALAYSIYKTPFGFDK